MRKTDLKLFRKEKYATVDTSELLALIGRIV